MTAVDLKPTKPGWWWWKHDEFGPVIQQITERDGTLHVCYTHYTVDALGGEWLGEAVPPRTSAKTLDDHCWYAGWYATRLHAVSASTDFSDLTCATRAALCGAYVYKVPPTDWAQRRLDNGIPHCKHCERIMRQRGQDKEDGG